jgi:hypothetical protein
MKKSAIITRVLTNCGRLEGTGSADRSQLAGDAIGEALLEAAQLHNFQSMSEEVPVTFATDSNSFALPEGTFQVKEVRLLNDNTSYTLNLRQKRWITRHFPNPTFYTSSYPSYAYTEGGLLYYMPKANADYTGVMTITRIPTLAGDDDELEPSLLATYVIAYATAEVYRSVEMFDEAAVWDNKAAQRLQLAIIADRKSEEEVILDQYPDANEDPYIDKYHDPFWGHDKGR